MGTHETRRHGLKQTFEVVGETQVVGGAPVGAPPQGFRFGRMFPALQPFRPTAGSLDGLGIAMTTQDTASDPAPGQAGLQPAGYTYLGQFIDHDITLDTTPEATASDQPLTDDDLVQSRSPSLDLDSLYGDPAATDPRFFEADGLRFRIGSTVGVDPRGPNPSPDDIVRRSHPSDLPRDTLGRALIGDARNDENLIIAQLHLAFLKFHNRTVDALGAVAAPTDPLFPAARALVTRHYQWLVLDDFVRRLCDPAIFKAVLGADTLRGLRETTPVLVAFPATGFETPPMPLEFAVAAYRFGHSMVRNGYSWNREFPGAGLALFFAFSQLSGGIGNPGDDSPASTFAVLPSNWIADWRRMFDFTDVPGVGANPADVPLNLARPIDTNLAGGLAKVPHVGNLASRNLRRGAERGLPSAQDVIAALQAGGDTVTPLLDPAALLDGLPDTMVRTIREFEFDLKTPLWFYILREAELAGGGTLGPLGSRIVIETFVTLIRTSKISIFNADHAQPGVLTVWSPEADSPLRVGSAPITTMAHLLALVGDVNPLGDPPAAQA